MTQLLANVAIEAAIAALIGALTALVTSAANWLNTRAKYLEQQIEIRALRHRAGGRV